MIVEKIREFVEEEFNKDTSKYGREPYDFHFVPMVSRAKMLAEKNNVEVELIEIAAWLHDIGSIIHGREDHHITGSEIAEIKLKELNYPGEKIGLIKKCILNHRGSRNDLRETIEEQIIAEADAMSNFENVPGIFKAAFVYENKTQGEAKESVLKKLENKWNQISEEHRELIRDKFDAVIVLLK
jgi:uncharacterized protein